MDMPVVKWYAIVFEGAASLVLPPSTPLRRTACVIRYHLNCWNFSSISSGSQLHGFDVLTADEKAQVTARCGEKAVPLAPPPPAIETKRKNEAAEAEVGPKKAKKARKAAAAAAASVQAVEDFDALPHKEMGVSLIEYCKVKKPSPCMR
jgi:hypothetical protein